MTTEQKLGENPYPKSWFEMYSEERQKREALEQERDEYKSDLDKAANRIVEVENQRDTLAETLKAIDEARRANLERAIDAEAEVTMLKEKYAGFEAGTIREIDNYTPMEEYDDERKKEDLAIADAFAGGPRIRELEAEVKRLQSELDTIKYREG